MPEGAGRSPHYVTLARELMEGIRRGRFPTGSMLPTEMELCERHGMSRITVRAAMRELEARGLVSRRAGIGTRVEASAARNRFVHTASSVEEFLQALVKLNFRTLGSRMVVVDAALAREIGCAAGEEFFRLESLRVGESDVPVCLSVHHVPRAHAAAAMKMEGRSGSLASRIAKAGGGEVAAMRQTFDARNLTATEAKLLKAKPREAALDSCRWYFSEDSRLLLYSRSLFPRGRAVYDFRTRSERLPAIGKERRSASATNVKRSK
jgi:GntR family transcriptional regulator